MAEATLALSPDAAAFVDAQIAPFAHRIGVTALERLVEEAVDRFMPELAQQKAEHAADGRHVTFHHDQVSFNGTTRLEGELDLADALDLDLEAADRDVAGPGKPRQVVLYVHLSEAALRTPRDRDLHLARVENTLTGVTADQVRTWCANPDTTVTVKPVIDLGEHIGVSAYEVPDRLAEQTKLRDYTCVFPWCSRPARGCDSDHGTPHDRGGSTCSCNVAPLCRRHHRLKTHSTWGYTPLGPGTYLWTSPHGYQFLRDHTGTLDVTAQRPPPRPDVEPHFS